VSLARIRNGGRSHRKPFGVGGGGGQEVGNIFPPRTAETQTNRSAEAAKPRLETRGSEAHGCMPTDFRPHSAALGDRL